MKKLILTIVLLSSISSFATTITCGHLSLKAKRFYPVNTAAMQLANKLGVVTCNGKRFQAVINTSNFTKKAVIITKQQKKELRIQLLKMNKKASSF